MPEIQATSTVDIAQAEYEGAPSTARAELAFFHLGQVHVELIEPIGELSTWEEQHSWIQ